MMRSTCRSCCGSEVQAAEVGGRVGVVEPAAHRVLERLRLLVDLLEHVVREVALVRVAVAQEVADVVRRDIDRVEVLIADDVAGLVELTDLPVVEVDDLVGVAGEGAGVAGEKVAVLPDADDERAAEAGADDDARLVRADNGEAVGALDNAERLRDRVDQVALIVVRR